MQCAYDGGGSKCMHEMMSGSRGGLVRATDADHGWNLGTMVRCVLNEFTDTPRAGRMQESACATSYIHMCMNVAALTWQCVILHGRNCSNDAGQRWRCYSGGCALCVTHERDKN